MDVIDLEDDTIDAEVMDSLAVTMDDFRVWFSVLFPLLIINEPLIGLRAETHHLYF